ncbi:hypothetical protein N5580_04075 [Pantoea piersonii]|uniref:Uncharacterized protein n=1 Tax=Pantoea piersonii TaxID=2364647 RepID=A0AAJ5QMG7_9GAMM|nr:hypothetical protein [Pantoea piersonii]WBG91740.1 hypothetical protein N5580_04075 [Pantoea piersonii]
MLGFSVGLVMLGFVVFFPVVYLISYGASSFDKWRLGEAVPRHKIKVNIILGIVLGIIIGGVVQHLWDNIDSCMQAGNKLGQCLLMLNNK